VFNSSKREFSEESSFRSISLICFCRNEPIHQPSSCAAHTRHASVRHLGPVYHRCFGIVTDWISLSARTRQLQLYDNGHVQVGDVIHCPSSLCHYWSYFKSMQGSASTSHFIIMTTRGRHTRLRAARRSAGRCI